MHAIGLKAGDLVHESRRDVAADRGDAVDTQRDPALQRAVGLPRLLRRVIARDVVGDEVEVRGDDAVAEGTRITDRAAAIDLVGVPDDVGLRGILDVHELHRTVLEQVLGVRRQRLEAHQADRRDIASTCKGINGRGREHLRPGLVRPEPRDVNGDRQLTAADG